MADDSSAHTKESIFGTDSDSDLQPCDESIEEDLESSQSAAVSRKKPRVEPESNQRVRLSVAQKIEAVKRGQSRNTVS